MSHSTLYQRNSRGAAQSVAVASISHRPAVSAAKAMRWVWPGSTARGSSQSGFQPAAGRVGGEGEGGGWAGFDGEGIQPERLPAVVEPVEQPEVVAMEVEHGGL